MRDAADNCVTVCNMENFDPLGVHTGITDYAIQRMFDNSVFRVPDLSSNAKGTLLLQSVQGAPKIRVHTMQPKSREISVESQMVQ